MDIRCHIIHDMTQKGVFELQYILTNDQTTDVHTKPLPRMKLEYLRGRLGVEENASLPERER